MTTFDAYVKKEKKKKEKKKTRVGLQKCFASHRIKKRKKENSRRTTEMLMLRIALKKLASDYRNAYASHRIK
jgi:hypothetical protein